MFDFIPLGRWVSDTHYSHIRDKEECRFRVSLKMDCDWAEEPCGPMVSYRSWSSVRTRLGRHHGRGKSVQGFSPPPLCIPPALSGKLSHGLMEKLMFIYCTLGNLLNAPLELSHLILIIPQSKQYCHSHFKMKLNVSILWSYSSLYLCMITCLRSISPASYIRIGTCGVWLYTQPRDFQ